MQSVVFDEALICLALLQAKAKTAKSITTDFFMMVYFAIVNFDLFQT
jgi:hypothetical protein